METLHPATAPTNPRANVNGCPLSLTANMREPGPAKPDAP